VATIDQGGRARLRYTRDTAEFSRVANLSDAVFAIAMTLLVLTLDAPDVGGAPLAEALFDRLPQLIAFVLAFGLVANIWWAHHKFVAQLESVERGLIAITLVLLGAVALVPFPTSLIGNAPTERAAVLPFIGLFVGIALLFLLMYARAQAVGAWRRPVPEGLFPWLLGTWAMLMGGMVLALVVAIWVPVAGLVIAAMNGTAVGVLMAWIAPPAYGDWGI
jgi:uncharacterized membrane protein